MGRSRRRNRHGLPDQEGSGDQPAAETLAPVYVTVASTAWSAPSDTPVLPLEGLSAWDVIQGPAIALYESAEDHRDTVIDSSDPSQLVLEPDDEPLAPETAEAVAAVQEPEFVPDLDRPMLVLEPEPAVEEQAELALVIPKVAHVEPEPEPEPAAEPVAAAPIVEPVIDPVELRYDEARTAAREGRLAEARAMYREVIAQRPSHLAARNNHALVLEWMGDQQGALAEYDRALELDSDHATLLTNRGALLGAMGRYAAAERDLKRVLRVDPTHVEALFNLGVVMTRKGLWAEAVSQLRRVTELEPGRAPAYFYLGEALNHIDDLYGAMAAYQRAAELMPDHPRALYGLGIVYDRLGRPDDAARMYRRSREIGRR